MDIQFTFPGLKGKSEGSSDNDEDKYRELAGNNTTYPDRHCIDITCTADCEGPTGVEMESLVGVSVAALTVYDMCKAVDKGIVVSEVKLVFKSGGKSGVYHSEG